MRKHAPLCMLCEETIPIRPLFIVIEGKPETALFSCISQNDLFFGPMLYAYCKRCIIFATNPVSQYRDIKKQKSSPLLLFLFQYFFNTSRRHYQRVSSANIFIGCFDFTCLLVLSRFSIELIRLKLPSSMKFLKTRIKLLGT